MNIVPFRRRFSLGCSCPPGQFRGALAGLGAGEMETSAEFQQFASTGWSNISLAGRRNARTFAKNDIVVDIEGGFSKDSDGNSFWDPAGTTIKVTFYLGAAPWQGGQPIYPLAMIPESARGHYAPYAKMNATIGAYLTQADYLKVFQALGGGSGALDSLFMAMPIIIGAVFLTLATGGALAPYTLPEVFGGGTFATSAAAQGGSLWSIFSAPSAPAEAGSVLDPQAIDGSMQTIYDANAAAGVPGYDPSLVSSKAGGSTLENLFETVKKIPSQIPGGSGVTIPGTGVTVPAPLVKAAVATAAKAIMPQSSSVPRVQDFLQPSRDPRSGLIPGQNLTTGQNTNNILLPLSIAALVALAIAVRNR